MASFCNVIYALLTDGMDEDAVAEFDLALMGVDAARVAELVAP